MIMHCLRPSADKKYTFNQREWSVNENPNVFFFYYTNIYYADKKEQELGLV